MTSKPSEWYVFVEGSPNGPHTLIEIAKKIRSGVLSRHDLVYRAGENKWRPIKEYKEFSEFLHQKEKRPRENEWVVLIRKSKSTGQKFSQIGPVNTAKVIEMLLSGEITDRDYVWQEGMASWKKISTTDKFNSEARDHQSKHSKVNDLEKKEPVKVPLSAVDEEFIPTEIYGLDLAIPAVDLNTLRGQKIEDHKSKMYPIHNVVKKVKGAILSENSGFKNERDGAKRDRRDDPRRKNSRRKGSRRSKSRRSRKRQELLLMGLIAFFASVVMFLVFNQYKTEIQAKFSNMFSAIESNDQDLYETKRGSRNAKRASSENENRAVKKRNSKKSKAALKAKREFENKMPPTYLKVSARGFKGSHPQLFINSDASTYYKIVIKFEANAGQAQNVKSVYWVKSIKRPDGEKRTFVALKKFPLPDGQYKITVSLGEREKNINIFLGKKNKKFKSSILNYRKMNSYWISKEKKRLFTSSRRISRIHNEIKTAIKKQMSKKKWSKFYLKSMSQIVLSNRTELKQLRSNNKSKIFFPKLWRRYKVSLDGLREILKITNKSKYKLAVMPDLNVLGVEIKNLLRSSAEASSW